MKKLLLLGGLRYLIPVIKSAHSFGYFVITCDNIPTNIAHKYSDEYHNISILDKGAVLKLALSLKIDGIMSFAVDPGVLTAAYVAEEMCLPFAGSFESVFILQNKDLFRKFLTDNNFNTPISGGYGSLDEVLFDINRFDYPIIVKPVDSAGSKGVTRVNNINELSFAVEEALRLSFSKRCIVEEFIEQEGYSSDSDCFSINGKLVFSSFSDQLFEQNASNPFTPAAYVWPNSMSETFKDELHKELQRLFNLLNLRTSIFNIETRISKNGKPYIMEVSPRGGGNRISEILTYATGVDLIASAVNAAVGNVVNISDSWSYNSRWSELILYSDKSGTFESLQLDSLITPFLVEKDIWVKPGDTVREFTGANEAIGTLIFKFDDYSMYKEFWPKIREYICVLIKD